MLNKDREEAMMLGTFMTLTKLLIGYQTHPPSFSFLPLSLYQNVYPKEQLEIQQPMTTIRQPLGVSYFNLFPGLSVPLSPWLTAESL